ncbi:MAG: TIGR03663 family protein [Acidobacteriota bacterium]|nr:TIGR03663 family protein [Acidobacteriota bacterium]
MATASTKSRASKRPADATESDLTAGIRETSTDSGAATLPATTGAEMSRREWLVACVVVLLVAAVLRCYELDLKPLHHDEGVNGFFLNNLIRSGAYRYDPSNYHGPTLYYFTAPLAYLADRWGMLSTTLIRLITAAFGVGVVWLALSLRRQIGMIGALAAAVLLAVSPGMVFFSRYYIHEMLFVFFTLGLVVAALKFYERQTKPLTDDLRKLALAGAAAIALVLAALGAVYWPQFFRIGTFFVGLCLSVVAAMLWTNDGARSWYWLAGWIALALLFATKETAFISVGVLLIAWAVAWGYARLARGRARRNEEQQASKRDRKKLRRQTEAATADGGAAGGLIQRLGGWPRLGLLFAVGLCVFLFVNILFFSSFFTHAKGVLDALRAYAIWQDTGTSDFHRKPFLTYAKWLFQIESPLVLLGSVGALFAVWRPRERFPVFAALWAGGMIAAYSLVPYKTPWLVLSMLAPLALIAGYAVQSLYLLGRGGGRRMTQGLLVALVPLALAVAVHLYQTYQINFVHYDDDSYLYVYAHTSREFDRMMEEVERIAARTSSRYDARINSASPDYWPMPWYLRDYKRVGYAGQLSAPVDQDVIIVKSTQESQARAALGASYQRVGGVYRLRPGVELLLYARRELVQ